MLDFIRRNKRRIATGLGLAAGAGTLYYVADRYVIPQVRQYSANVRMVASALSALNEPLPDVGDNNAAHGNGASMSRDFAFRAQQQSCNSAISALSAQLVERLQSIFNVEAFIERLKCDKLESDEKVEIWSQIRAISIARLFALAYGSTVLTICMKVQVGLLASDSRQTQKMSETDDDDEFVVNKLLQYFMRHGIVELSHCIDDVVRRFVSDLPLTRRLTPADLRADVFSPILREIDFALANRWSTFLINDAHDDADATTSSSHVGRMLSRVQCWLDTPSAQSLLRFCVNNCWLDAYHDELVGSSASSELQPLAKWLPVITRSFALEPALQNSLKKCDRMRDFAKLVSLSLD